MNITSSAHNLNTAYALLKLCLLYIYMYICMYSLPQVNTASLYKFFGAVGGESQQFSIYRGNNNIQVGEKFHYTYCNV